MLRVPRTSIAMTPASSIALIVDQYVLVRLLLAQWMEWLSLEILDDLLENTGWSSSTLWSLATIKAWGESRYSYNKQATFTSIPRGRWRT
jgi:hypothetical protein